MSSTYPDHWPDHLHDAAHGHYNEQPHVDIDIGTSTAEYDCVKDVLRHMLDGEYAWTYDGGMFFVWGDDVDESFLEDVRSALRECEHQYSADGDYDYAKSAQHARSRVGRAKIQEANEGMIC